MLMAHLHFSRRYPPHSGFQVDFRPFGMAQFTRTGKNMRRKLQSQFCRDVSSKAIYRPQKRSDAFWVYYRRMVSYRPGNKRACQIRGRINPCPAGLHGIAKHARCKCAGSLCRFVIALLFYLP